MVVDPEVKHIHTDFNKQSVSMKVVKTPDTISNDVVSIAMETGEQMKVPHDPTCDGVVALETGEKLVVGNESFKFPPTKESSGASDGIDRQKGPCSNPMKVPSRADKKFFFIKHDTGMVLDVKGWNSQQGPSHKIVFMKTEAL